MDSAIQTSFKSITHNLAFRSETKKKGENLAKCNRVRDTTEYSCNSNEDCFFIDARVIRQASATTTPYRTELYLDRDRQVTHTFCSCIANKSSKCKHLYALIYYIQHQESLSRTNFSQEWGKPTALQFAKRKYSKGNSFEIMFGSMPKSADFEPYPPLQLAKMKNHSALRNLMVAAEKRKLTSMVQVNVPVIDPDTDKKLEECKLCLDLIFEYNQGFRIYGCPYVIAFEDCLKFYNERIVKSNTQIKNLCCDTIKQSESDTWFDARRLRISPSQKAHSIKTVSKKPIESLVLEMAYLKKINNKATKYGLRNEKVAEEEYKKVYGYELVDVGVIVSPYQPWLCGSLDAVVVDDGCITKIVEIKCPESCEYLPIIDWEGGESNVKYLVVDENYQVKLRESSVYFTQCQVQMYISGMNSCDLYVYSPCESCCISIERNEEFLQKVISKCEEFYFSHYLPKLLEIICKEEEYSKKIKENLNKDRKFTGRDRSNVK